MLPEDLRCTLCCIAASYGHWQWNCPNAPRKQAMLLHGLPCTGCFVHLHEAFVLTGMLHLLSNTFVLMHAPSSCATSCCCCCSDG